LRRFIGYVRDAAPTSLVWPRELQKSWPSSPRHRQQHGESCRQGRRIRGTRLPPVPRGHALAALAHQHRMPWALRGLLRLASDYFEQVVELDAPGAGIGEHHLRLHALAK
jgi:hypothetical protein